MFFKILYLYTEQAQSNDTTTFGKMSAEHPHVTILAVIRMRQYMDVTKGL